MKRHLFRFIFFMVVVTIVLIIIMLNIKFKMIIIDSDLPDWIKFIILSGKR